MTEQHRHTGRFVTNGSADAHAALVSRLLAAKHAQSPLTTPSTPTPDQTTVPTEGGYRTTVPTTSADPSGDHSRFIGDIARRKRPL